jgi:1-deoxy-D-xylulose-5-phosphate synthase
MTGVALRARDILASRGVSATVVNCRFIKPMDRGMLRELRSSFPVLVTVEENSLIGGFGNGVLETLDEEGLDLTGVIRAGLPDEFVSHGSQRKLLMEVGLTPERLAELALQGIKNK